jgi:hypothetical protein
VNAPSTANDLWYGLTEQGHPEARIICLGETDLNLLISQGASFAWRGYYLDECRSPSTAPK